MNDPKVVMVMEPRQARVVVKALDNYGRMGMIQLDAAVGEFLRVHYWDPNANPAEEHLPLDLFPLETLSAGDLEAE